MVDKDEMKQFLIDISLYPPGTLSNTDDLLTFLNYDIEPAYDANEAWVNAWVTEAPDEYLPIILEVIADKPDDSVLNLDGSYNCWVWYVGDILRAWGKRDLRRLQQLAEPYLQIPYARSCLLYAICSDETEAVSAWIPLITPLVDEMKELPIYDQSLLLDALHTIKQFNKSVCPLIKRFFGLYPTGKEKDGFIESMKSLYEDGKF